ncbi:MAG: glycosyltransferase family 39 protein [Anaerolineae bacterium]|nr:glycosyltransferase family 39 protein [Anaerolineae bacterium]
MNGARRVAFWMFLAGYLVLGTLFALYTPPWQVPDEPAHYNYIRALATERALPVIEPGDYDQEYLSRLTALRFPPGLSIAPLRYEDHQPPLYYLLAVPVFLLFGGALLPLRLFSLFLGALLLVVIYRLTCDLFPDPTAPSLSRSSVPWFPRFPFLPLAAVAWAAFLPQHLAIAAGVNNDILAELLLTLSLWLALRPDPRPWTLGIVLGLCMLTKTTAYVALPVALLALWWPRRGSPRAALAQTGRVLLAALILAGPWLIRNISLYGWMDPLGLARHNAVVVGQPRTEEWLAQMGPTAFALAFLRTTFQSFWGQFGWMGVPMHPPVYLALAGISLLLLVGLLGWTLDRRRPRLSAFQRRGLVLLTLSATLTSASYIWYNLTFVQHQGRYLFPAIAPMAVGFALALDWLAARGWRSTLLGLSLTALPLAMGLALRRSALPLVGAGVLVLLILILLSFRFPHRRPALVLGAWSFGMVLLNLYALFWAIVPTLTER